MKNRDRAEALELLVNPRGHYLLSRALFVAIQSEMRKPGEAQEVADLADMLLLALELFPMCFYSAARQEEDILETVR